MRCKVELREQETEQKKKKVECYKCREEEHKCRECPLWKKVERKGRKKGAVHVTMPQKVQQKGKLARPTREEAQEAKKRLRRAEEDKAVHVAKP